MGNINNLKGQKFKSFCFIFILNVSKRILKILITCKGGGVCVEL